MTDHDSLRDAKSSLRSASVAASAEWSQVSATMAAAHALIAVADDLNRIACALEGMEASR